MPARVWSGIDAGMDNASQTAFEEGAEDLGFELVEIRETGGRQIPGAGPDWPADDQVVSITLSQREWALVLDEARSSTPMYEQLGDRESAALARRAVHVISPFLP